MFVKDGGTLIIFAQCRDGLGSDAFIEYFDCGGFKETFARLEKNYKGNGGTALSMMTKTRRINIFIKTDLDDTICRILGMKKIEIDDIEKLLKNNTHDSACIENASLLIVQAV